MLSQNWKFLFSFFVIAGGGLANADEKNLFIYKIEGEQPRVEATGVDLMGAAKVHKFLGEDFVVFDSSEVSTLRTSTEPVRPVITPPGTLPPILPICQCPEDYVAGLERRLIQTDAEELLSPKRFSITPNSLIGLGESQVRQLEEILENSGPLFLNGQ